MHGMPAIPTRAIRILSVLFLVMPISGRAAPPDPDAPSLGIFLDGAGRLDLEKARLWGYDGPVDATGYRTGWDPEHREPVFIPQAELPEDANWAKGFHLPGLNSSVAAFIVHEGLLVAGGAFIQAGEATSPFIASWDGTRWQSLGRGMSDFVIALEIFQGELYAGGNFRKADDRTVNYIARWDGSAWQPVGGGTNFPVWTLEADGDYLYAGGDFTRAGGVLVNHVARWDGTSWSGLGVGVNDGVLALEIFDGKLHAAGIFDQTGNDPVSHIASWDGAAWTGLGDGLDFWANSMTVYGGSLVVGGDFASAGSLPVNHVARWDGTDWHPMGSGTNGGVIDVETVGEDVIAVGPFSVAGGVVSVGVARWNGSTWGTVGERLDERGTAIGVYNDELVVSGFFTSVETEESTRLDYIARLDNGAWKPLFDTSGRGMNSTVTSMAFYNGDLIVGGFFTMAGGVSVNGITRWNGSEWQPMSSGVAGAVFAVKVLSFAVDADSKLPPPRENTLYIGGSFEVAGGRLARSVAYWDDTGWKPISEGLSWNTQAGAVYDLEEFRGKLYAAGFFNNSGTRTIDSIARFDPIGRIWTDVDELSIRGVVRDLQVYNDELLAAGAFTQVQGEAWPFLVRWTGGDWLPFPVSGGSNTVFGRPVYSLRIFGNSLIAAGEFSSVNGVQVNKVARWDGYSWQSMGPGFTADGAVSTLGTHHGLLIAAGSFPRSEANIVHGIAYWSGSEWKPMGSGLGGPIAEAYAVASNGTDLFVGGDFTAAGTHASSRFARWTGDLTVPVELASLSVSRAGAHAVLEWEITGEPANHAGFHVYRTEPGQVRVRLTDRILAGQTRYRFEDTAPPAGGAEYWLAEIARDGAVSWHGPAVLEPAGALTPVLSLGQNMPNPFQASTRIAFETPEDGPVRISVYSVTGREIARLLDEFRPAGRGEVAWNGRTSSGRTTPAGVYFYRLDSTAGTRIRQLTRTQ